MLDVHVDEAYASRVATSAPAAQGDKTPAASQGRGRRQPPSPQEQARRTEWGRTFGPMVKQAYDQAKEQS